MSNGEKTAIQEAAENADRGGLLFRRWLGAWIDLLALAGIFFGSALGLGFLMPPSSSDQASAISVAITLGLCLLYFPVLEGVWGRTLGKLLAGTKVVDKNGRVPGIGPVIVRTLFRLIEVNPVLMGGVPAGIAVLATKRKQRLGDLVAGTYVLSANSIADTAEVDAVLAEMRSRQPSP